MEGELEMIDTPEVAYLLEEQEKKIANLICENYRLKGLLDDAGIPYTSTTSRAKRGTSSDLP